MDGIIALKIFCQHKVLLDRMMSSEMHQWVFFLLYLDTSLCSKKISLVRPLPTLL